MSAPASTPAAGADQPSYKRKRSSKACIVCRQKKVRCSGTDPCRHCIEFGETCNFDEHGGSSTKNVTELQLRIRRLEDFVIAVTGYELPPLLNYRLDGSEAPGSPPPLQHSASAPTNVSSAASTASRKRSRQDYEPPFASDAARDIARDAEGQDEPVPKVVTLLMRNPGDMCRDAGPVSELNRVAIEREAGVVHEPGYVEELQFLHDMTHAAASEDPDDLGLDNPQAIRNFSEQRKEAQVEEIDSTDDEGIALAKRFGHDPKLKARTPTQGRMQGDGSSDAHMSGLDGSASQDEGSQHQQRAHTASQQTERQSPAANLAGGAQMHRSNSSHSSILAQIFEPTAKIGSSSASELRPDRGGNLRYLGSASTSSVVAELADRQRWDVEYPILSSAAAARKRGSASHPQTASGSDQANGAISSGANGATVAGSETASAGSQQPKSGLDAQTGNCTIDGDATIFAHPAPRPKPWSIFASLGVTVAGALPPAEDVALPPEDLALKLVDAYFERLNPLFPVLHRLTFESDLNKVYRLKERGQMVKAQPTFLTLMFAVFACGSLLCSDDERVHEEGGYSDDAKTYPVSTSPTPGPSGLRGTAGAPPEPARNHTYKFGLSDSARKQGVRRPGHRYYAQCNVLILHSLFQPSIDQAALYGLMALFHVGSNAAARAWVLAGQALRLGIELGLHRSSMSFKIYVRERRRRVFWALFCLESLLANVLGRPPNLPLWEIDQERPQNICLDDVMPNVTTYGPPRKGDIAGFLHLIKVHYLTAEALRTISRHQRLVNPISREELQRRLLKYEAALQEWFVEAPNDLGVPWEAMDSAMKTQKQIIISLYPSVILLLFLPFMPRRGEEPDEFQLYALTRCVGACKDHIVFSESVRKAVPPCHYLFNFAQHLLVSGALLLLICHRGLENTTTSVLHRTLKDVDKCIEALGDMGATFVGGAVGYEMLVNMKDNMRHSEAWKEIQNRLVMAKAAQSSGNPDQVASQVPTGKSKYAVPEPQRTAAIVAPATPVAQLGPRASAFDPAHPANANSYAYRPPIAAYMAEPTPDPKNIGLSGWRGVPGNVAASAQAAVTPLGQAPMSTSPSGQQAHASSHGYAGQLHMLGDPNQSNNMMYDNMNTGRSYQSNNMGMTLTPHDHQQAMQNVPYVAQPLFDDINQFYQANAGSSYAITAPMQIDSNQNQALWPSDTFNLNIAGLEQIASQGSEFFMTNLGEYYQQY